MKIFFAAIYCAVILSGCSLKNMAPVANCPDVRLITPPAGKAALVIAETMREENYDLEDNPNIANFLDRKFIGRLRSSTFFVTMVEPGRHYVVANGENRETILLDFKAGETYYLEQETRMGYALPRTRFVPVKADRLHYDLQGKCECYAPDPLNPGRDLDEERFAEIVKAYVKEKGNRPVNEEADQAGEQ